MLLTRLSWFPPSSPARRSNKEIAMKTTRHVAVELSAEETVKVLEDYVRAKQIAQGLDMPKYKLDDIDVTLNKDRGAYLFFIREMDNDTI